MNSRIRSLLLFGLLPLLGSWNAGCSLFTSTHDPESFAASHMEAAEGYERSGDLGNATREYAIVVSAYPLSEQYPLALWKAATLYLNDRNPAASDSSALSLLTTYVNLPGVEEDKSEARLRLTLLERIASLKGSLSKTERNIDSLSQVVKKQTATLGAQAQHLTELETEVRQTKDELTRLKEVDVQLSRLHRRR